MATSLQRFLCVATVLSWMSDLSVAMELELDGGSSTDSADLSDSIDAGDRVRSLVVGGVIGAGTLLTLCLFIVCGTLHCYFTKDKVIDLDSPIQYNEVKEHEVWINFDVLDQLDPTIRANIDLDYLAHLTNTDPALLEKYKVQPSPGNKGEDSTYHSWTSSLNIHLLFSPARASLQGVHALLPPPGSATSGSTGFRRSATVRNKSLTNNDLGIKRVPTIADFSNLLEGGSGLNLSQTNLSRLRSTADIPLRRGSNPNMATERKGSREEALAVDLLRLLTVAKMANTPREAGGQQEREEEIIATTAAKTDISKQ